ncbi:MAG: nucleotidyl transferase AbiEii/AbiGii toxin family protein [Nanoarchaeota archaeon]|nr:nucleotidyl transferase AbiEii/AbiGii toxin family protein [Nanoarchaeota archaeon]MBU1320885.1 nucleotidyl transferase AbiEii/AbiGii toxin family protein [Nanoarchaeota archaeon]MBU1597791.1 nucleotidyl transferase AbiEii/AbiGii toxin family protein [Nanoarchaeota archaeon]MBU2441242.1 nucleotidyl transferase AbiEii/AbiGii toxin family protein [Nanoarchaeota archaeon]
MISIEELKKVKEIRKTSLYHAEKEYFQYIFLNSISKYSSDFVFKGGTCLRIAFELERASEDLDFNTSLPVKEIKTRIRNCLKDFDYLNITHKIYSEKIHKGNYRAEIRFQGPLYTGNKSATNTIKIDCNKRRVFNKETRVIKKAFSDIPPFTIRVMAKEEILAEKLRALCMRVEPRDLYDTWLLINLGVNLNKKLLYTKLREDNIREFRLKLPSKKEFQNDLKLLLKSYPDYEQVIEEIKQQSRGL